MAKYHNDLLKFKNTHKGETAYIFGSGPSIKQFNIIEDGIFIGCNHILLNHDINNKLKYYFFGDGYNYTGAANTVIKFNTEMTCKERIDHVINYRDITTFCSAFMNNELFHGFSQKQVDELYNKKVHILNLTKDIDNLKPELDEMIVDHSIIFTCLHFALYCGFLKIYIVGCDCSSENGSSYFFLNKSDISEIPNVTRQLNRNLTQYNASSILPNIWKKMKIFKDTHFPNTKLISINPVKLKGLLDSDLYT
jgi:hypothetical protein